MIDLHIHSNYSDGSDSIEEIVAQACALKLTQIAITDHNTMEGALYAKTLNHQNLEIVCGIELSCDFEEEELHILGYFPPSQTNFEAIEHCIQYNEDNKYQAQCEMIHRLAKKQVYFTYEEMQKTFPNTILNRVHLAKMIVLKGYAQDVEEAFNSYIGVGKSCYVNSKRCSAYQVIEAIHACNGLAYIAHPFKYKQTFMILEALKSHLDGIEVCHSSFSEEQSQQLIAYAKTHQLKTSGGSDYHGSNKKNVNMGEPKVEISHAIVF